MGTGFAGSESTCSSFKDPLSVSQLFGFVQALATSRFHTFARWHISTVLVAMVSVIYLMSEYVVGTAMLESKLLHRSTSHGDDDDFAEG